MLGILSTIGTTARCQRKVRKQFEKATERKAQVEGVPEMGRDRKGNQETAEEERLGGGGG
jgi:hypothetical protein